MRLQEFNGVAAARTTVVILGAGASRGASFVPTSRLAPPVDADFFTQLAKLPLSEAGARLIEFVREEYGYELGLSMERFFSDADYTTRFHSELKVDRGPRIRRYERALGDFYLAAGEILSQTTAQDCEFHKLIAKRVQVGDTILSFNYDTIMDRALKDSAGNRWNPNSGYAFAPEGGVEKWRTITPGQPPKGSIELLKLHGSLNWRKISEARFSLIQREVADRSLKGVIVPPTWFKKLDAYPFRDIWKRARLRLRKARALITIGYSVPPTDTYSQALLKVEVGAESALDVLAVANPDRGARARFVDLVRNGLGPKTHLLEFERLSDLTAALT